MLRSAGSLRKVGTENNRLKDSRICFGRSDRNDRTQLTVESDWDEDAKLSRVEQSDPESQHRRDEVGEGGLPEAVESRRRVDQGPHRADDDSCERRLWDPVKETNQLVNGHENDAGSDKPGQRRLDLAGRVDRCPGHGTADTHGMEEAVKELENHRVSD